ncbi:AMP-binding protein [Undibacterium fentianense]|uniref:AMP-binding protein n=1 Tax=Undibacterium fentianense TaxID=2828728 RepID=A0A941IF56_9BURK|nr:AMP-binding protein [Undibacterium fentianense]MBR7800042.1 AMP-binding protein [Undibacterium fentianense]
MPLHFPQSAHIDTFTFQHLPPPEQWPELLFDLPELQYPERLNCANAFLEDIAAQGFADKIAIRSASAHASLKWTYAELCAKVNQIAHVIVDEMRLAPGNRVLLRGANNPMMAACILAVWKVGCVAVPTMPLLRAKELSVIIDKAQISAALCSAALHEELEVAQKLSPVLQQIKCFNSEEVGSVEQLMQSKPTSFAAVDTHAEDVCLISFTSGTTGMPKGTMHFHRDVLAICDCFPRSILQSQTSDIFIGTPPLAFTFGLGGLLLFPLRIGATAVLLEKLTPETLLKSIDEYQATVCFTAPTFYRQMLPMVPNFSLKSLQKTVSAGETLPAATREAWQAATGLIMIDGIGATEMLHIFISAAGEHARSGATGKAVPGYQACVLDEQGNPAPVGVTGRLAVKGPTGCRYLADDRQKNYVLNGWNLTGDAYEMDAEGYFHYRARTDDMIITAGYNVAGPEVEEIILKHPAVAECAVVGLPDEERGQIVKAFVVLRDASKVSDPLASEALVSEIQQFVKANVAPYKYPRCIEFKDALPRTETGKVQRFKLKTTTAK